MKHVKQQLACHIFKYNNTIIVNPSHCKVHIVGTNHCINTDYKKKTMVHHEQIKIIQNKCQNTIYTKT